MKHHHKYKVNHCIWDEVHLYALFFCLSYNTTPKRMNSECFSVSVLYCCSLIHLFKTLLSSHISLQVDICLHSKQEERSDLCISLCNMPFMCLFKWAEAVERIEENLFFKGLCPGMRQVATSGTVYHRPPSWQLWCPPAQIFDITQSRPWESSTDQTYLWQTQDSGWAFVWA